jgi:hypothetical protein
MRKPTAGLVAILVCLTVSPTALAQYGHPLKGQWSGDWGPGAAARTRVLVDLDWDGKAVVGTLNPGAPNAVKFTRVTAEPVLPTYDAWNVRMEGAGGLVIEGKLVNIGSYNRTMSGTWMQGGQKGDFKLTRN